MHRTARSVLLLTLAAVLALAPSACGKDNKGKTSGGEAIGTKPKVTVPSGNPPTALQQKDLIVGKGAEAKTGSKVTVQYVGVDFATGKQFDASWDSGRAFPFTLGAGNVIKGWDEGVPGMKVGGRRQLVVPPALAYGPEGYPPVIGPNETLVFVVDLVSVS
jgi:peptidylprolyl isomerase